MGFVGNLYFSRFDENELFSSFGSLKIDDFFVGVENSFSFGLQYFIIQCVAMCPIPCF